MTNFNENNVDKENDLLDNSEIEKEDNQEELPKVNKDEDQPKPTNDLADNNKQSMESEKIDQILVDNNLAKNSLINFDDVLEELEELLSSHLSKIIDVFNQVSDYGNIKELLSSHLSETINAFNQRLAYDDFKEQQIRDLHNELQTYKSDIIMKAIRPIIVGAIHIYEDAEKVIEFFSKSEWESIDKQKVINNLEGFRDNIIYTLQENSIDAFQDSKPGDEFNPKRQRIMRKIPITDQSLVGRVVESLRYGFQQGENLIQKESVSVYTLTEQKSNDSPNQE